MHVVQVQLRGELEAGVPIDPADNDPRFGPFGFMYWMGKIGGTQLFRAESAGLTRDTKLTPRIADTAKLLWAMYAALTALCIVAPSSPA
jgi:hypothetical protein